jgi:hypothetical protein
MDLEDINLLETKALLVALHYDVGSDAADLAGLALQIVDALREFFTEKRY